MIPEIYFIETIGKGKLAIMPRPRGNDWLEDEIKGLGNLGYDIVVSFLEKGEEFELELSEEKDLCEKNGLEFVDFPLRDRTVPEYEPFVDLVDYVYRKILNGKNAVVHCRGGIGRAGIAACSILVMNGEKAKNAISKVSSARKLYIPDTEEQKQWIYSFESKLHETLSGFSNA